VPQPEGVWPDAFLNQVAAEQRILIIPGRKRMVSPTNEPTGIFFMAIGVGLGQLPKRRM